jgi:hypothetical protein
MGGSKGQKINNLFKILCNWIFGNDDRMLLKAYVSADKVETGHELTGTSERPQAVGFRMVRCHQASHRSLKNENGIFNAHRLFCGLGLFR